MGPGAVNSGSQYWCVVISCSSGQPVGRVVGSVTGSESGAAAGMVGSVGGGVEGCCCMVSSGGERLGGEAGSDDAERGRRTAQQHRSAGEKRGQDRVAQVGPGCDDLLQPAESVERIERHLAAQRVPVWMPARMAAAAPDVEPSWRVTSDSLAAWLSGTIANLDVRLSDTITKLDVRLSGAIASLEVRMDRRFEGVDRRFESMEARLQ